MRIEDGEYVGSPNEVKIFKLLCEGNTQIQIADALGFSKPYINQVTKLLLSFDLIIEKKSGKGCSFVYEHNMDLSEIPIDIPLPKKKKPTGNKRCKYCGKLIERSKKFCNQKCRGSYQSGPKSANWKGGTTFKPYCWKFNESLKLRVRAFFNHTCFACGETEDEDALHVHHVQYNKMACCDGEKDALLIPLCTSCHNRTNRDRKNGFWERLFYTQLVARTGGKCYYSKKEWRLMGGVPPLHHLLTVNENLLFFN